MFHIYILWKRQKTSAFLTFSGGVEIELWPEMGLIWTWPAFLFYVFIYNFEPAEDIVLLFSLTNIGKYQSNNVLCGYSSLKVFICSLTHLFPMHPLFPMQNVFRM